MQRHFFFILCIILIFTIDCVQQEKELNKINLVVSIMPLAGFAKGIGGDKVSVSVMVPPGASPHTYEPTPGQLKDVSKAKLYVKVGSPIEFELVWLDKILSANKDIFVVDASYGIEFMNVAYKHHNGNNKHNYIGDDPHIWLSPKNAKIMVENICNGFVSIDPDNKEYYLENKKSYFKELDELNLEIEILLAEKIRRRFMVYHPSWAYFARDYNLEQIPIEKDGKEPTARSIQFLIEQARIQNIKVIFASPQFNTESAQVVAREVKGQVVLIDPLQKDYITNMKKIARVLSEVME
ncbi:zinc ABC transporter substrate-binding protein [candidate division WOR-3 bacterium]|jgi:zinc transport system substrate-binding protein|nr:zinc ABC transporter substrate-binding protein [candidate division WOR-3 bacterium]